MDFDNLYKVAKTFLIFSVGLLIFSFSIKMWTGGGGCCKTSWKTKNYSCIRDASNGANIDIEVFAITDDEFNIKKLDALLQNQDLPEDIKALFKNNLSHSHEFNKEFIDTLDDGSISIKKFKTIIIDDGE